MRTIQYLAVVILFIISACNKTENNITPNSPEGKLISDAINQVKSTLSKNLRTTSSVTTDYRILQASSTGTAKTMVTLPSNKSVFYVVASINTNGCYDLSFNTTSNNNIDNGCLSGNDNKAQGTFITGTSFSTRTVNFRMQGVPSGKKMIFAWGYN